MFLYCLWTSLCTGFYPSLSFLGKLLWARTMRNIFSLICCLPIFCDIVTCCCSVKTVREPEIFAPVVRNPRSKSSIKFQCLLYESGTETEVWYRPEEWNGQTCREEERPRARDNQPGSCNTDCDCVPCEPYCSRWRESRWESSWLWLFDSDTDGVRLPGGVRMAEGSSRRKSAKSKEGAMTRGHGQWGHCQWTMAQKVERPRD